MTGGVGGILGEIQLNSERVFSKYGGRQEMKRDPGLDRLRCVACFFSLSGFLLLNYLIVLS